MTKVTSKVVFSIMLVFFVGCANTKFNIQDRNDGLQPRYVANQHYFLGGIGQEKNIDPAQICGEKEKIARVETQQTFVNGLVTLLTWGIYSPLTARVYCSK